MRVLIVGAGAVGQVYGRHLEKAGWDVNYFVREKYAAEAREGYWVYPLNETKQAVRFAGFGVFTAVEEVLASSFDQVWLCVPQNALMGEWLGPFLEACGGAKVVNTVPGLETTSRLKGLVGDGRVLSAMIGFIAWQAPLPGEQIEPPGIMYWFPPGAPSPFSGPDAGRTVAALKAGGLPAKKVSSVASQSGRGSAVLLSTVAALEACGWSFEDFRAGEGSDWASACSKQAVAVAGAYMGQRSGPLAIFATPWLLRMLTTVGPCVVPFDLETYIAYHFDKVGAQTRLALESWIRLGHQHELPVDAIEAMLARLRDVPAADG